MDEWMNKIISMIFFYQASSHTFYFFNKNYMRYVLLLRQKKNEDTLAQI